MSTSPCMYIACSDVNSNASIRIVVEFHLELSNAFISLTPGALVRNIRFTLVDGVHKCEPPFEGYRAMRLFVRALVLACACTGLVSAPALAGHDPAREVL